MGTLRRRLLITSLCASAPLAGLTATAIAAGGSRPGVVPDIAARGGAPAVVPVSTAGSATTPVTYPAPGGNYTGMRPTGLGLPQIGESGTVGAGSFGSALSSYVSSGQYAADLSSVAGAASSYLDQRLAENSAPTRRSCTTTYRRVRIRHVRGPLYRRGRHCSTVTPTRLSGKPAVVLDIDETSLSNLQGLQASSYTAAGLVPGALGQLPAIAPTLAFYRDAVAHHVAVFFITGRGSYLQSITAANLSAAGYDQGNAGIDFKPADAGTEQFKSSTRAQIESQGYDIIANLGDQESDLDGGHADRAFKLPNPFYFISD